MKIALLSDVHGNLIALESVIDDIRTKGGVDEYWVLGDLAALGYAPAAVLERLVSLPQVLFVRGNTDRYLVSGERPDDVPTLAQAIADPKRIPQLVEVEQALTWTQGYLAATGWLDWLAALPLEQRRTLPNGTRLLAVHAAPGTDDGPGIRPDSSDADLNRLVAKSEADLICGGHTHWPCECQIGGIRAVNVGSVSNPPRDRRASYALLDAQTTGYTVTLHRVAYNYDAVIEAIAQSRMPAAPAAWLLKHFKA